MQFHCESPIFACICIGIVSYFCSTCTTITLVHFQRQHYLTLFHKVVLHRKYLNILELLENTHCINATKSVYAKYVALPDRYGSFAREKQYFITVAYSHFTLTLSYQELFCTIVVKLCTSQGSYWVPSGKWRPLACIVLVVSDTCIWHVNMILCSTWCTAQRSWWGIY